MLKRPITYTDLFTEEERTEEFYFAIFENEIIELEAKYPGGLEHYYEGISKSEDNQKILALFKELVLLAYGEKSEDGKRFIKNDELREAFSQTAAYNTLFIEFFQDASKAADFFIGILPKKWHDQIQKQWKETQATQTTKDYVLSSPEVITPPDGPRPPVPPRPV